MRTMIGVLAMAMALGGCATHLAMMDLPPGFERTAERIPVASQFVRTGRTPVAFGDYVTAEHYGWSLPSRVTVGASDHLAYGKDRARFGFTLQQRGAAVAQVRCNASSSFMRIAYGDVEVEVPTGTDRPILVCDIDDGVLLLWQRDNDVHGEFRRPHAPTLRIAGERIAARVPVRMAAPVGYSVSIDARPLMAVDMLGSGIVWMGRDVDAPTRAALAAAASALLMVSAS